MEKVTVNYYDIDKCGFYRHGASSPDFGAAPEVFEWLKPWAENRDFVETTTYEVSGKVGSTYLEAYCYDIAKASANNDYCLVTWNRLPDSDGKVYSVPRDAKVGNVSPKTTNLPSDSIPGYATYFWIVPEHQKLLTIRLEDQRLNGHKPMKQLVEGFMAKCSPWVVEGEDDQYAGLTVSGYQGSLNPDNKEASVFYRPFFRTSLHELDGNIPLIRSRVGDIRKIIRKSHLPDNGQQNQTLYDRFFQSLGFVDSPDPQTKCRLEVAHEPTRAEVDRLINSYFDEENEDESWSDVGFEFYGESGDTKWLSRSLPSQNPKLNLTRSSANIIGATDLIAELQSRRSSLLSPVLQ